MNQNICQHCGLEVQPEDVMPEGMVGNTNIDREGNIEIEEKSYGFWWFLAGLAGGVAGTIAVQKYGEDAKGYAKSGIKRRVSNW